VVPKVLRHQNPRSKSNDFNKNCRSWVYLCDSILTPSQAEQELVQPKAKKPEKGQKQVRLMGAQERLYKFKTVVGEFAVPSLLVKAQYIDQLAGLVEECVDAKYLLQDFRKRLLQTFPLVEGEDDYDIQVLDQLYAKIKELDEKAVNGIWARIIKNAFAPLFCGEFDYVAGNPPWVNWDSLPDDYRKDLIPLNQDVYQLFPHSGLRARHGSSEIDIATLMFYVSVDRYLRGNGKLGFVITQSVFKSDAGKGFRGFSIKGQLHIKVVHIDDMVVLKPFEAAENRTSVIIVTKGASTNYPVPYTIWLRRRNRGPFPIDSSLENVMQATSRRNWVAAPILEDDPTSPWVTARPRAALALRRIVGESYYRAHVGVHTGGANGIYWLSTVAERPDGMVVIANASEEGRKFAESIQVAIEPDFIHPLLRGRDVSRWMAEPSLFILAAQDPARPHLGLPEVELKSRYPKTYSYLQRFRPLLERRVHFKKYLEASGAPWYSLYDIKEYTYADHKVIWREQTGWFAAAVVPTEYPKTVLPDHKLMLVDVSSTEEAHYLCAILNASVVALLVKAYAIDTQISTHVLKYTKVPKYNARDRHHLELAALSQQAHQVARADRQVIASIESRIDELAAEMWGLSRDELKEIQESLAELKS